MEIIFERVSRALAAMTGLGLTTCHYLVLATIALAVVTIIVFVFGRVEDEERPDVPMSFEEAQPPGKSPAPVFWGGRWLPEKNQKFHFAITGTTRSGKSLLLSLYLRSILSRITPGSDRRLILFDPKNELHPYIFDHAQVPVSYLLPSDRRSCRWDLARDFDSPAAIMQFCQAVLPDTPGDSNPFFRTAFRELMDGVINSLNITQPGRWDLGDVVHILESADFTAQVLDRTPDTRSKLRFMDNQKTWENIAATLETRLNELRIMAALWSRARRTFSLVDFVHSEGILIMGRDPRYAALLDPLNMLLLTQLFSQLLAQNDSQTRRTHLVIDELTVAAGEDKTLPGFKDICERGAARGVVVAVAYQSYADVQALYKQSGDAILGMLQHQVFLRAGDYPTAEFGAKNFGKKREWIWVKSETNTAGDTARSQSRSEHWHEVDVVPFEKFLELEITSPEDGLSGYRISPGRHDAGLFHLPGSWVAANLPKRNEDVEPYLVRPTEHQYLESLSYLDLQRLKLTLPAGGAAPMPPITAQPAEGWALAALPPPPAEDDIRGKLRRLIGSDWRPDDAPAT